MSSKHSRVRFQMSNWIYHNSTGAPGPPPHNISFCLSIHSSLAQPDCVAAAHTRINGAPARSASQQVELRVEMLPDLVVVLAQGALEHDLLRTSAALQHNTKSIAA